MPGIAKADKNPLHTLTTTFTPSDIHLPIDKIVVAVDLSPRSEATARYAVALAKPFRALVNLVHVEPPEPMSGSIPEEGCSCRKRRSRTAEERLSRLAKRIRKIYPDCQAVCLAGEPAERV